MVGVSGDIFLGRKKELRLLREIFSFKKGISFDSSVVILEGEAGVGKTRLLGRFVQHCRGIDILWQDSKVSNPWAEILWGLFKLRGLKAEKFELYRRIFKEVSLPREKEALWERISETLSLWAGQRPILILLEDLDRAEGHVVEPLKVIARNIALEGNQKGLGIITTLRLQGETLAGVAIKDLLEKKLARVIKIEPFGKDQTQRYIKLLLGGQVEQGLVEDIWDLTMGNPLFVEMLVRSLLEDAKIYRMAGRWCRKGTLKEAPYRIGLTLQERLKGLCSSKRKILELMAVMDKPASIWMLSKFFRRKTILKEDLQELSRRGFIELGRGLGEHRFYRLRHGLLREAIYQKLSLPEKQRLHRV